MVRLRARCLGPDALVERVEGGFAARVFGAAGVGLLDEAGVPVGRLDAGDRDAAQAALGAALGVALRCEPTARPLGAEANVLLAFGAHRALLAPRVVLRTPAHAPHARAVSIAVGCGRLASAELKALGPGDELHLPVSWSLVLDDGRCVRLHGWDGARCVVGEDIVDPESRPTDDLVPMGEVELPVVVEAARLALSADAVAALAPGAELPVGPLGAEVLLRVLGTPIARGVLQLDGSRLVVRITDVSMPG